MTFNFHCEDLKQKKFSLEATIARLNVHPKNSYSLLDQRTDIYSVFKKLYCKDPEEEDDDYPVELEAVPLAPLPTFPEANNFI